MGLFSKKSNKDDILNKIEDDGFDFAVPSAEKIKPHHVLTADEITGAENRESTASDVNPLESLKARMRNSAQSKAGNSAAEKPQHPTAPAPTNEEAKPKAEKNPTIEEEIADYPIIAFDPTTKEETKKEIPSIDEIIASVEESLNINLNTEAKAEPARESEKAIPEAKAEEAPTAPTDTAEKHTEEVWEEYKREIKAQEEKKREEAKKDEPSLLEKCLPYIVDESGNAAEEKPAYTLESIENILNADSDKIIEQLAEKYDVRVEAPKSAPKNESPVKPKEAPAEPEATRVIPLTEVQTSLPDISDIDNASLEAEKPDTAKENPFENQDETIRFTPIKSNGSVERVVVSHSTQQIDLTGELIAAELPQAEQKSESVKLEFNDFDEFVPTDEYKTPDDLKRILRKLSVKNRNAFLQFSASALLFILTLAFRIPVLYEFLVAYPTPCMGVCSAFTFIAVICNLDIFKSVKNIANKKSTGDISAFFAIIGTAVYTVASFVKQEANIDILLLLLLILCFRALGKFMYASQMLATFRSATSQNQKRAVKLIDEPAVTNAMARDAIEGEILVAAPQKTNKILDFMKYSEYGVFLGGKQNLITFITVFLAVIFGFVNASITSNALSGFFTFAAVLCFAALPTLFLIDSLPLFKANKSLRKRGAAVIGKSGAAQIEAANAVILNSSDIFPFGTITLHNMHVLSENSIDDTIIRAAALTKYIDSPLASVFARIASTLNGALPEEKVDSVKYEKTLGVSGWVDDKLLFIGNRTLLESHGISAPPLTTDHKILRNGYFPIYVASDGQAYALLIVSYNFDPEIAHELKSITSSGITVLVNNCDQNVSEKLLCDNFGLYEDSVRVMNTVGVDMYKNAVHPVAETSAPGLYKGNPLGLTSLINCSARIRKSNLILTVIYILSLCVGTLMFLYAPFAGSGELLSSGFVLLFGIISTVISYLGFLIQKP